MTIYDSYYLLKPFIPRRLQIALRRQIVLWKRKKCKDIWPIDPQAGKAPAGWQGWPEGKKFALVLTHDVDTAKGRERVNKLAEMERALGFKSNFNFVGQDYPVYDQVRKNIIDMGFEIGVHGLTHKGNLFRSKEVFEKQLGPINKLLKQWNVVGFRAPSMYHNLQWIGQLDIEYDLSTFDTDPFEPQPDGMKTIFPFVVRCGSGRRYVELPYTLPQDHLLFVIMRQKSIEILKRKLDWIVKKGGMALINVHPDYTNFGECEMSLDEYPIRYYEEFLEYVKNKYEDQYWHALPRDVSSFLKNSVIKEI